MNTYRLVCAYRFEDVNKSERTKVFDSSAYSEEEAVVNAKHELCTVAWELETSVASFRVLSVYKRTWFFFWKPLTVN